MPCYRVFQYLSIIMIIKVSIIFLYFCIFQKLPQLLYISLWFLIVVNNKCLKRYVLMFRPNITDSVVVRSSRIRCRCSLVQKNFYLSSHYVLHAVGNTMDFDNNLVVIFTIKVMKTPRSFA